MKPQLFQILVILLLVGLPGLARLYQNLKEQAEKRRIEMELERRRIEALRTGRNPDSVSVQVQAQVPPPQQRPRLQDLAQKRQAQLEELRRRAQARAAGSQTQTQAPAQVPTRIPGSSGPTIPVPTARPRPGRAQPAPRPVPVAIGPVPQRRRPKRKESRARAMDEITRRKTGTSIQDRKIEGGIAHSPIVEPVVSQLPVAQGPKTTAQWRQAIIAAEILGRPLAMRKPDPHDPMAM